MCARGGCILPVCAFLAGENAVKIWVLHTFREKIACYVLDTLCLIVLTVFSDGSLISTLYIIILSEFYLGQKNLAGSIAMGGGEHRALSRSVCRFGRAEGGVRSRHDAHFQRVQRHPADGAALPRVQSRHSDLAQEQGTRRRACGRSDESNKKLRAAYEELDESNKKLQEAYQELQEVTALEERQRIAKDIHDTAGHSITTIIMQTEAAKLVIDSDPEDAKRKIAAANLQARNALEELRESVHLLSGATEHLSLRERSCPSCTSRRTGRAS